jgi:dTDP-4-dehydrorhamnose reductase
MEAPLELWGGFECTIARIRGRFRDQIAETGHAARISDLDAAAGLGIRTLRYPALWESVSPKDPDTCDWSWLDARFAKMQALDLRPVAGLLHHGSGPRYTNLLDPEMPALLARHAGRVAERYPWIDHFTPVNEPLTTARFSGLYGHWYPHHRTEQAFLRMLVNQCKATVLAMRAIRRATPGAQLVQTEDIGKTFSTRGLATQADYENERRWLSLDLLHGWVDRNHPWHARLVAHGIDPNDLALLRDGDGMPDLIGVNHYLTSERYLDGRVSAYPKSLRGGNGRRRYADAEAVRVILPEGSTGPLPRLLEIWERYRRPLATTEVHHGCTRDEQLRWLTETWVAAEQARAAGVPVRAVTLWSLLGAVDWNSLLVERAGFYEPGAFDIRAPEPRRTALGQAAASLTQTGAFAHPVLDVPGWWRRETRLYGSGHSQASPQPMRGRAPRALLVVAPPHGYANGLVRICRERGLNPVLAEDDCGSASFAEQIACCGAWGAIDASGLDATALAKRYPGGSFVADAGRAERLAATCAAAGQPFLAFSTDLVFPGRPHRAACERDAPRPASLSGASALDLERRVRAAHPKALVVRTGALFGEDASSFASGILAASAAGRPLPTRPLEILSAAYLPDLVHAALDLLIDGEYDLWHLVNAGETTWAGLSADLLKAAGLSPLPSLDPVPESRLNTALASERGWIMPTLESAIARYVRAAGFPRTPALRHAAE